MKTLTKTLILTFLTATTYAAPTPEPVSTQLQPRQGYNVTVFFSGAGGAGYTVDFLVDSGILQSTPITNPLSVSSIFVGPAECVFEGADGSSTFVLPGTSADVGPPQRIVSGSCDIP